MTDTERDLLRVVCEWPERDEPRLVYADAIEAEEPERAEFIRVQCNIAKDPMNANLLWREAELFSAYKRQWFGEMWAILYTDIEDRHDQYQDLTHAVIRRGFPDAVTLSLQQFWGGECGECNGDGYVCTCDPEVAGVETCFCSDWPCDECDGKKELPGLVAALAKWPVTSVRLSCREPLNYEGSRWGWFRQVNVIDESTIPNEIWQSMKGHHGYGDNGPFSIKWHPTPDDAHLALSRACVDVLRARAGLRRMEWQVVSERPNYPQGRFNFIFTESAPGVWSTTIPAPHPFGCECCELPTGDTP